jgi:hypothetical protein
MSCNKSIARAPHSPIARRAGQITSPNGLSQQRSSHQIGILSQPGMPAHSSIAKETGSTPMLVIFGKITCCPRSRFLSLLVAIALFSVALEGQAVTGRTKNASTASLHLQANIVGGVVSPARTDARKIPEASIQYNIDSWTSTSQMDVHEVFSPLLPVSPMRHSPPAEFDILKTIVLVSK